MDASWVLFVFCYWIAYLKIIRGVYLSVLETPGIFTGRIPTLPLVWSLCIVDMIVFLLSYSKHRCICCFHSSHHCRPKRAIWPQSWDTGQKFHHWGWRMAVELPAVRTTDWRLSLLSHHHRDAMVILQMFLHLLTVIDMGRPEVIVTSSSSGSAMVDI